MSILKYKFTFALFVMISITTFMSCEKEIEEEKNEFIGSIEIGKDETNTIIRFEIPKDSKLEKITITGTLYEYEATDQDAINIKSFTIDGSTVVGNCRNIDPDIMANGEPVPGIEVLVEQEPNDDPIAYAVTDPDNGSFTIVIKNPVPGFYLIRSGSNSSKAGFAVGGFNAT